MVKKYKANYYLRFLDSFFTRVKYTSLNEIYSKLGCYEMKVCYCGFALGQTIFRVSTLNTLLK